LRKFVVVLKGRYVELIGSGEKFVNGNKGSRSSVESIKFNG
jgi:hypothetical protein